MACGQVCQLAIVLFTDFLVAEIELPEQVAILPVIAVDQLDDERLARHLLALPPRLAGVLGGQGDVVESRHGGHQVEALEDEADLLAEQLGGGPGAQVVHPATVQPDLAGVGLVQAAHHVEHGGFAASGGAHDGHHLARTHVHRGAAKGVDVVVFAELVALVEALDAHDGLHRLRPFFSLDDHFGLLVSRCAAGRAVDGARHHSYLRARTGLSRAAWKLG